MRPLRDEAGAILLATHDEVRRMDALAIEGGWSAPAEPIPGRVLMELAGARAAALIAQRAGGIAGKAVILCGPGNNGGDGYVVARHLFAAGWTVRCVALAEPTAADARVNADLWKALGGEIRMAERGATARMKNWLNHANAIVDGLFGTGLGRALEGAAAELVEAANDAEHGLRYALDLPSGIDADRGTVMGVAFRADVTVTFGIHKLGLYLGAGPDHAGEVVPVDVGWVRPVVDHIGAAARLADADMLRPRIPARPLDAHKGTFGHVAVIGGFAGTEGAAILAARGALRAGAGLVSWCAPDDASIERPAEVMRVPFDGLPERASVLVIGPGLGSSKKADKALDLALADARPQVWDADALNAIARRNTLSTIDSAVLTPHPLEAARLLGVDSRAVQADRIDAARRLAEHGAVVVLKGRNPIVAHRDHPPVIFDIAEPTLAVGGTGDVLAGVIGAFLAQGLSPRDAALLGVFVHGRAGTLTGMGQGHRGVLASEIADAIPTAMMF